jgi:tripeptide aminopeptidase
MGLGAIDQPTLKRSNQAMSSAALIPLDTEEAERYLMKFLSIDSVSGHEGEIAAAVADELKKVGVPAGAIRHDRAQDRIPLPAEVGNLLVELSGTRQGTRLLFSAHLDTVELCRGAKPRRENDRIVSDGTTALGGDNCTGCAVLVALAQTLLNHKLPHPPITLLFTVREESGLHGARVLDRKDLGGATMGFNVDSSHAAKLIIGGVGKQYWQAEIKGKAAHAGIAPEKGISSTMVASIALAEVYRCGWFGKIEKPDGSGTSNAGIFLGKDGKAVGNATNVITDYVQILGEARSLDPAFVAAIVSGYRSAFARAQAEVKDVYGANAEVNFESNAVYPPFSLDEHSEPVEYARKAAHSIGLKPYTALSSGGLDANWLVKHGVPTVTFGAGQAEIHSVNEYVDLLEFAQGCRLAVALATLEG